ncbi:MAG TPA: hypothetical protein VF638_00935 [Sphingomonas sp.]|jgi:hypothetical protein
MSEADGAAVIDGFYLECETHGDYAAAVAAMRKAERTLLKMLEAMPDERNVKLSALHKKMVRLRREYGKLEQERGAIVGTGIASTAPSL